MSDTKLKDSLDALRAEVGRVSGSHPEQAARLKAILADLEHASRGGKTGGVVARVREAVLHLEVEHPKVVAIVNDVLLSLGNAGM